MTLTDWLLVFLIVAVTVVGVNLERLAIQIRGKLDGLIDQVHEVLIHLASIESTLDSTQDALTPDHDNDENPEGA